MIEVKEAVRAAQAFARDMYSENELRHLRLEELERSEDERTWRVTLGWVEPAVRENVLLAGAFTSIEKLPRVYKVFEVDGESGQVRSMKIRGASE